ncbi:MAG: hypothetical protein JWO42_39 [Chloroflexi bacterium]|nr:hypothetical protein [Chloroflexota bacterium]
MDSRDRVSMLAKDAERIMRDCLGREISLHHPALIAQRERSLVVRCAVTGWDGVASVVLKRNEGDDARGFTDWASLEFLSILEAATGVAPRYYAGAAKERFLVMEDLGASRSLADVLDGSDNTTVIAALQALAASMGLLVEATAQHEEAYDRLRAALPGADGLGRQHEARRWLASLERVAQWANALGIQLPAGFNTSCEHVAAVYAEPGTYLAFSHGDPAPSNNHVAGDRVSLVDFEYGGYRHALYDLTAWDTLCPLPREWVAAMEAAFLQSAGSRLLGDVTASDNGYREARSTMCAYRALAMLTWFSPEILQQDQGWAPGWTRREALISTCLRLQQTTVGVPVLEPLTDLGGALARVLQASWPELGDGTLRWPGVTGTS